MTNFGRNLEKLRKDRNLSYRKVSSQLGISHTILAAYERGTISPSLENVLALCKFFNVSIEHLLVGEKAESIYNDLELFELFCEVDDLEEEYRQMVKAYIQKVLIHRKEKQLLLKELNIDPAVSSSQKGRKKRRKIEKK